MQKVDAVMQESIQKIMNILAFTLSWNPIFWSHREPLANCSNFIAHKIPWCSSDNVSYNFLIEIEQRTERGAEKGFISGIIRFSLLLC